MTRADDEVTLVHEAAGGEYEGVSAGLVVTVADDESAGVVLSKSSLAVGEGDTGGESYGVSLSHVPSGEVTVSISGHAGSDVRLSTSSLTFTADDWDEVQLVSVMAVGDDDAADDEVTLVHEAAGGEYEGASESLVVTVTDDESAAVVLSRSVLTVGEGDTGGESYGVSLSHVPSVEVTVSISGHAGSDVRLSSSSLTFTADDWDTVQLVSVSAVGDDDAADDEVTLVHEAAGGEYQGASESLVVTVADDESAGVVLSKSSLNVGEGDADGGSYGVSLSHEPSGEVTVTVSGHAGSDVRLSSTSLTFTADDWDEVQLVSVRAVGDDDAADDEVTLVHEAAGGEYEGVSAGLVVTVVDDESAGVVLSRSWLSVGEGDVGGGSYGVSLSHVPSGEVTVTVSGHVGSDVRLSSSSLTFTADDWDTVQLVTVMAVDDDDAADDEVTLFHEAAGGEYQGASESLVVTVTDDESAGLVLSKGSLTVEEGDVGGGSYGVRLSHEPSVEVTVSISGHAGSDVRLSTTSLTFTADDWDEVQLVSVSAVEDSDAADESVTLVHSAAGGEYEGVSAGLGVTVEDDESAGVVLSKSVLSVEEGDVGGGSYGVSLSHEPSGEVTVTVSGHAGSDVRLSSTSLTFTADDWDEVQLVSVRAVGDDDAADDEVTLVHEAAGGEYEGVSAGLVVTVVDDESAGVVLSRSVLTVGEGDAGGGSYGVRLSHVPSGEVTVSISGHVGSDVRLSSSSLTFTSEDWDTVQFVSVTAVDDDDAADDTVTLVHEAVGGEYEGASEILVVTVADDESAAVVLSRSGLTVEEGDSGGGSYGVRLSHVPSGEVTVSISGHVGSDVRLSTTSLTFTVDDWDEVQLVSVSAVEDSDAADDEVTLVHEAAGGEYEGVSADLGVTVTDDESAGLVLSKSSLSVGEGDVGGGSYGVRLSHEPSVEVTVSVSGHVGSDVRLSTSSLTFTADDWDEVQLVSVTAVDDDDAADDSVTLVHEAAGGEYEGVSEGLVVTVADDESASVVLSKGSLAVGEGDVGGGSYGVRLSHEPSGEVTVSISGHAGSDVRLSGLGSGNTLTFTVDDWDEVQLVSVSAVEDSDAADDEVTLVHLRGGGRV